MKTLVARQLPTNVHIHENMFHSLPQYIVHKHRGYTTTVLVYTDQYLSIQRWARAYRDTTFHNCVNTNNGTESLNKALKYTYLPRRKQLNLSGVVTTIVETFLPALRQKYLFANFEQSSCNRTYKNHIPVYLHNRPRNVILHCLDRKASSCKYSTEDVEDVDSSSGVFSVISGENSYTVNFQSPSCTCPDWTQTQYPCKHFFAVFRLRQPQWTWSSLPNSYLTSPRLSLDQQAIDNYFNQTTSDPLLSSDDGFGLIQDLHDKEEDLYSATLPRKQVNAYYINLGRLYVHVHVHV